MVSIAADKQSKAESQNAATSSEQPQKEINVGELERVASVLLGGLFVSAGLKRFFSARGWLMGGLGYALLQRGASGHCAIYEKYGINTADQGEKDETVCSGEGI